MGRLRGGDGDPRRRFYTAANIHNDYRIDYELQKELNIGIPFLGNLQDRAMTETMGPIYDRTQEHLGTTDAMVIFVRRRLIEAARALRDEGAVPANVDDANLCRVRPASAPPARGRELDRRRRRRHASPTPACPSHGCPSSDERDDDPR